MSKNQEPLVELDAEELRKLGKLCQSLPVSAEERAMLGALIETIAWLLIELEKKSTTLAYLRESLSITTKKTEKTDEVLRRNGAKASKTGKGPKKPKSKPKGHGRHAASAYKDADKVDVPLESLTACDSCPGCIRGKVYRHEPKCLVRLKGRAPIAATVWEIESLRCNLCGEVFRADVPPEATGPKYDESAASMIALLKYGSGLPFYRLAGLQSALGIPLPASTQWDVIKKASGIVAPACKELIRQAAQGSVFYNDDTTVKVLALMEENQKNKDAGLKERTGMFTTAVLALTDKGLITLYLTGRKHAGENLGDVLKRRAQDLGIPIQMCDGSSRNKPTSFTTWLANCLAHGRRKFVEVAHNFPGPCRHVLETLAKVYKNDAAARKGKLSPLDRLRFHKKHSAKHMARLKHWMLQQFEQRKVEPISPLGAAFSYMLDRWDKMTLFLRRPGAPLDNNLCELSLKKAILHRKNALFYKTTDGADVGDIFMSLIYTAQLAGANPFDYLTQLLKHGEALKSSPQEWMPWNYKTAVEAAGS